MSVLQQLSTSGKLGDLTYSIEELNINPATALLGDRILRVLRFTQLRDLLNAPDPIALIHNFLEANSVIAEDSLSWDATFSSTLSMESKKDRTRTAMKEVRYGALVRYLNRALELV